MVKTIYIDESGFTGSNLLDKTQPFFVASSTCIDEGKAKDILEKSFPHYNGDEYKFSNIWKSTKNKNGLVQFSKELTTIQNDVFSYIIDKELGLLAKMIDFLIEPFYHHSGFDFYKNGFSWKYLNYFYFGFKTFAPEDSLSKILNSYLTFSLAPSIENLDRISTIALEIKPTVKGEIKHLLDQIVSGVKYFEKFHDLETFGKTLDVQFTTFLAVISYWKQRFNDGLIFIHDETANFSRKYSEWEKITNKDVKAQMHPLGGIDFVEYPLKVLNTKSVDSKENYAVQFCDMLAGLTSKFAGHGNEDTVLKEVLKYGFSNTTYNGIRFQAIFPENINPSPLTSPDAVDVMVKIIEGK